VAEPFIGEIKLVPYNFAPRNWAYCNGQLLPINQNQALFSLLGTNYGGNGVTTFALPNLQGRVPMHRSDAHPLGESAGQAQVTLTLAQLPVHTHVIAASGTAADSASKDPAGRSLARSTAPAYVDGTPDLAVAPVSSVTGGSQAHSTMQPYLTMSFVIALVGIFPSRD
jgi:microcystin-dependent protein